MYLLFDIGGTNTRLSYTEDLSTHLKPAVFPTPKKFEDGIHLLEEIFNDFIQGHDLQGIAGGIAGQLNGSKSKLVLAPNLPDWKDKPLKLYLERIFSTHVRLENDSALAALGEASRGAGKDHKIVAYINIGTGVGGARVIDGILDRSAFGFEPGHQIINISDFLYSHESAGSLESYVSGSAIQKTYNKPAQDIKDEAIWEKVTKYLAIGLYNTILHWSPDVLVLGGSVTKSLDFALIQTTIQDIAGINRPLPIIRQANLGQHGGITGAMVLLENIQKN